MTKNERTGRAEMPAGTKRQARGAEEKRQTAVTAERAQPPASAAVPAPEVRTRRKRERAEHPESVVTVQVKTPHPVPPREEKPKRLPREEREKRRWVADTVRDLFFAVLGGVISFLVSLLIMKL